MPEYKVLLGALAIVIGIFAYIPYLRDLWRGKTKPHAFSWIIWGIMTSTGFFASMSRGGGAGVCGAALSSPERNKTGIKTLVSMY